jgi:inorganic triphosphatase YgiF
MEDHVERELKLVPGSEQLLARLFEVDHLGRFQVRGRRRDRQRNAFFDNADRSLGRAQLGFRRRIVEGRPTATWTVKGETGMSGAPGVASRYEMEVELAPETSPSLALNTLQQMARQRGAAVLADEIADALADGGAPLPAPYLETETDRRLVDLASSDEATRVELALDEVRLVGHRYEEREIEAELKRGDEDALEEIRHSIEAMGEIHPSAGSKLSRALAHLRNCDCP